MVPSPQAAPTLYSVVGLVRLEIIAVLLIVHLLHRFCHKNLKK